MTTQPADAAARLRGSLPASPPGAAALYKAAELAHCPAHSLFALTSVSPGAIATQVLRLPDADARSPLAIARGVTFERSLRARDKEGNDAARLRGVLADHAPSAAGGALLDIGLVGPAGRAGAETRDTATLQAIRDLADGSPRAPSIVWQPSLHATVAGARFRVRPDLLIANRDGQYEVGEIKSWPEDGPRTDPAAVRSALGQAAVGTLALAQAGAASPPRVVLIAAAARRSAPRLRTHGIARELHVLAAADTALGRSADTALAALGHGRLDDPQAVAALPTRYGELCRSRCALARWCRDHAAAAGDPAALGPTAAALSPSRLPEAVQAAHGQPGEAGRIDPVLRDLAAAGQAYRVGLAQTTKALRDA